MNEAVLDDGRVVELGGSIGIAANRHFVEFSDMLDLQRVPPALSSSSLGVWNGEKFVYEMDGSVWSKLSALGRCVQVSARCSSRDTTARTMQM